MNSWEDGTGEDNIGLMDRLRAQTDAVSTLYKSVYESEYAKRKAKREQKRALKEKKDENEES